MQSTRGSRCVPELTAIASYTHMGLPQQATFRRRMFVLLALDENNTFRPLFSFVNPAPPIYGHTSPEVRRLRACVPY